MVTYRQGMTAEEQQVFLTHTRLFLSREIKRAAITEDVYALKHVPSGRYLRVSGDELYLLGCFARGSTCAELLPHLVMNRRCPSLDRFYELVLRACDAGVLSVSRDGEFAAVSVPGWWPSLDSGSVQAVWWSSCFAGFIAFFSWDLGGKDAADGCDGVLGVYPFAWLSLSVAASFGSLLASAHVYRKGGEVRRPHFYWRTLLPRLTCDWSECELVGRDTCIAVAKLRITPFLLMAFVFTILPYFGVLCSLECITVVVIFGLLWRIAPYPGGPSVQWLEARHREPLVSTSELSSFYRAPSGWSGRFVTSLKGTDWRFTLWLSGYAVIWGLMVIWFFSTALFGEPLEVLTEIFSFESLVVLRAFAAVIGLLAAGGLAVIVYGWVRSRAEGVVYGKGQGVPSFLLNDDIGEVFDDSPLLRELPMEFRATLMSGARRTDLKEGEWVLAPGAAGDELYVLEGGELDVVDRAHSGAVIARLRRGDVFGELPFFGHVFRPCNMRAVGSTRILSIASSGLETVLRRYLNASTIEDIVLKRTLIRRMPLSAVWSETSIGLFARFARFEEYEPESVIVVSGRENRFFFLILEGSLEMRERGRKKVRLCAGDFFGEISLLTNNVSVCDVVAVSRTRCLVVQKSDFLTLMGQDVELALQIERIASTRQGRPIFPYKAPAGDVPNH